MEFEQTFLESIYNRLRVVVIPRWTERSLVHLGARAKI